MDRQAEIENRLVEKVEQLRQIRTAFKDILTNVLGLACHHLNIEFPQLNELPDYEKLAYKICQIYGMPDPGNSRPLSQEHSAPSDEVFHSLRLALEQLIHQ